MGTARAIRGLESKLWTGRARSPWLFRYRAVPWSYYTVLHISVQLTARIQFCIYIYIFIYTELNCSYAQKTIDVLY